MHYTGWAAAADRVEAIADEVMQQVAHRLPPELQVLDAVQNMPSRYCHCQSEAGTHAVGKPTP